jgi:hypothetical protein
MSDKKKNLHNWKSFSIEHNNWNVIEYDGKFVTYQIDKESLGAFETFGRFCEQLSNFDNVKVFLILKLNLCCLKAPGHMRIFPKNSIIFSLDILITTSSENY